MGVGDAAAASASPRPPLQPPEISPVATGSRGTTDDLKPGQLGAPVLGISAPTVLPEPAGLSAALSALANGSMFRAAIVSADGMGATVAVDGS